MKKIFGLWPILAIIVVWITLFWPFFSRKLLPIPADIITGVYFPWLDYKWGFTVGVPVKNPLISDIPSLLYPWRSFVIDELKAGRWPLWNSFYFGGMPLLANFQSAVFSYVNVFFLFLPKALAWSAGVMASPLLTMLAMYAFLQHKKLEQFPSLLGAIVFSLSGFEIAWMEYNVHGHTALFLPLLLLTIDYIFENKKSFLFLLPLFVAFQIFSGYIPVVIYSYVVCLFYVFFFHLFPSVRQKKIDWQKYFLILGYWILGLGIAAIQLLPGYELTSLSIRKTDPIVSASNASNLPLKNLITLLAPDFFGNPATGNYFGRAFYDNFYFFAGTGTLIFVLFSLFFLRKSKNIFFWWGILVFSFILCLKNPLGSLLEKVLFLSGGVASKALFITDFSLSILVAEGFHCFINDLKNKRKEIFASIGIVGIFFLIAVLLSKQTEGIYRLISIRNLAIPFAVWLSCLIIILTMLKFPRFAFGKILLVLVISFQLLYSAKKYLPFSKQELLFPSTPVIDFIKEKQKESDRPFRVELGDVIPQNFLMPYGIETTSGYDALLPRKTAEFFSLLQSGKIDERISRVQLISNFDSPLFPLLNTKYIFAKKTDKDGKYSPEGNPPGKFLEKRYKLVFEDKTVQVYEDTRFFQRATFFENINIIEDPETLVFELDKQRLLSKNNPVQWKTYSPLKKIFMINAPENGFVFLADSYFPGWQANINNIPAEILETAHSLQLLKVSAGENLITLEYKPKSFYLGKTISLSALVFLLASLPLLSVKRKIFKR